MTASTAPLYRRNDTILGVCEAIGQDFGFHANWLRIALASVMFFSPTAAIALYFGLGAIVAVSRWIAPNKVQASDPAIESQPVAANEEAAPALAA